MLEIRRILLALLAASTFAVSAFGCSDDPDASNGAGGTAGADDGGDDGAAARGSGASQLWVDYCAEATTRAATCNDTDFSRTDCIVYASCLNRISVAATESITECLLERPCSETSDDLCFSEGVTTGIPSPNASDFRQTCERYAADCAALQTPLSDQHIGFCQVTQFDPDYMAALEDCMTGACSSFAGCARDVALNLFGCDSRA